MVGIISKLSTSNVSNSLGHLIIQFSFLIFLLLTNKNPNFLAFFINNSNSSSFVTKTLNKVLLISCIPEIPSSKSLYVSSLTLLQENVSSYIYC